MPLHTAELTALPSHFCGDQHAALRTHVAEIFPSLSSESNLQSILKLCVASPVYHSAFLRETLSRSHSLLAASLFRNTDTMGALGQTLVQGESPWMTATGIPSHVELYRKLENRQKLVDNLSLVLLECTSALIEEKGVASGNITKQLLEEIITKLLERVGVGQDSPSVHLTAEVTASGQPIRYYEGKFHLLPQDFEPPKIGPFGVWKLWWLGDKAQDYPPVQCIRPHDLATYGLRKRFSNWSALAKHIANQAAMARTPIPSHATEQKAAEAFGAGRSNLPLAGSTRKRRVAELSVATTLRLVRQATETCSQGETEAPVHKPSRTT